MTNFINWDAISAKARESTKIPSQQLPSLHVFLMQYRASFYLNSTIYDDFENMMLHRLSLPFAMSMGKLMKLKLDFASRAEARKKIEFTHSTCIKIHSMILNYVDDDDITTMMMGKKKVKYDFDVIFKLSMAFFWAKMLFKFYQFIFFTTRKSISQLFSMALCIHQQIACTSRNEWVNNFTFVSWQLLSK